jgi:hypothetical protein
MRLKVLVYVELQSCLLVILQHAWNVNVLTFAVCCQGIEKFSLPVGLDDEVHVDLIVVGCVAVSPRGKN